MPEGPLEGGPEAVAGPIARWDAVIEVMQMLGVGPIPVAGTEPIEAPFATTMDWTAFAVAVAAFVLLFLVAVIVAAVGRRGAVPVSRTLRPQTA